MFEILIVTISLACLSYAQPPYMSYCNANATVPLDTPGSDYKLGFVLLLTRHGDRYEKRLFILQIV